MQSLEKIKNKLKQYQRKHIIFNEPHFTNQLILREGSEEEVIKNLLNPEKLVYHYKEKGKKGDDIFCLYFKKSNTRTIKLPIIFNKNNERNIYVLTYILRYRPWHTMIKRKK